MDQDAVPLVLADRRPPSVVIIAACVLGYQLLGLWTSKATGRGWIPTPSPVLGVRHISNSRYVPGLRWWNIPAFQGDHGMRSLQNIHSRSFWQWTDKGTTHSYVRTYERLLASKRCTARNVIEI
jgi:hypothetical protein